MGLFGVDSSDLNVGRTEYVANGSIVSCSSDGGSGKLWRRGERIEAY